MAGTAACAGALCAGCVTLNPAPTFEASPDGSLPVPAELHSPGSQVKVRLPGVEEPILVWRTTEGLGAASVVCTHRGCEVAFNSSARTLDCPCHGSRFAPDGKVMEGPARRPLKAYKVEVTGGTMRVTPL